MMRAVFMGTPDFSVPVLSAMAQAEDIEVVGVVTQPDRPKGRKGDLVPSPVKEEALKYNIPLLQPEKIRQPEAVEQLRAWNPDVIVVVAFGQILTRDVLEIPRMGCINVHASLLPKYRGAAPIQYAVLDGLKETGVTTMYMDEGLDTGDILLQQVVPIAEKETGGSLFDKLSEVGAGLLIRTLEGLSRGEIERRPQTGESGYVGMIKKSMGEIDWSRSAEEIERQIRGLDPWPSAYTYRNGRMLKLWGADVLSGCAGEASPGEVAEVQKDRVLLQTGEGILAVTALQPEGKKRMAAADYLRGYPVSVGERWGR